MSAAPTSSRAASGAEEQAFVVQFDCAEAVYFEGTEADAWELRDDFACEPKSVTLASECDIDHAWTKNGWLRVQLRDEKAGALA